MHQQNVFEETPCDTEVGGSVAQALSAGCTKDAQFMAMAVQLMVQKSICAWLVNACALAMDPPPQRTSTADIVDSWTVGLKQ